VTHQAATNHAYFLLTHLLPRHHRKGTTRRLKR
jgi:hypothetical protein